MLAQLACDVRVLRPVSRTVFHPVPNVDSVLVGLRADAARRAGRPRCARSCRRAFAHRRKALARLARAGGLARAPAATSATAPGPRSPSSAIPPTCAPSGSRRRTSARCGRSVSSVTALRRTRAGEDQPLPARRPVRAGDGRHELVSVMDSVSLADELLSSRPTGGADEVVCPGVEGPNLAAAALAAFRARDRLGRRRRCGSRSTSGSRSRRHGGRLGRRRGRAAAARRRRRRRRRPRSSEHRRRARAPTCPARSAAGRVLATGAGSGCEPPHRAGPYGVLVLPVAAALSTPAVYAEADRSARCARAAELEEAREPRCAPTTSCRAAWRTTCSAPARSLCPAIDGALADARRGGRRRDRSSPAPGRRCSGCSRRGRARERARVAAAELAGRTAGRDRGRARAGAAGEPCDVTGVRHTAGDAR